MGVTGMTTAELERLKATIREVGRKTKTAEQARAMLREEGVLTTDNELTEPYAIEESSRT